MGAIVMRVRAQGIWFWSLAAAAAAAAAYVALTSTVGADYPGPACLGCDYAGPPISALAHRQVGQFFQTQPLMGSFSLLLRVPAALVAHGSVLWQYRIGALLCLLGPLVLALALQRWMERQGSGRVAQATVVALCVANPLTVAAMHWGHPEEPLAAALCVAAVLLAAKGRPAYAGLAFGLALATKPWAWLVLAPVLLAAPERRRVTLAVGLGVGALFTLPMLAGDPSRFLHHVGILGVTGRGVTPFNVWWGYAHEGGTVISGGSTTSAYAIPAKLAAITHPLVIVVAVAASLLFWRMHPAPGPATALRLVALLFLVRCLLDPLSISYHHLPFLLALIGSEAVARRRGVPYISLAVAGICFAMSEYLTSLGNPDLLSRVYLAWSVPVALYLAYTLFARTRLAAHGRLNLVNAK